MGNYLTAAYAILIAVYDFLIETKRYTLYVAFEIDLLLTKRSQI